MAHMTIPHKGCFHASYPDFVWTDAPCEDSPASAIPMHVRPKTHSLDADGTKADTTESVGNGTDYVAATNGLISFADGSFPQASFISSEKGVGGIVGPNEYALQLNSNDNATTSACAGHSSCKVWQQFVYATDYAAKGKASVFIQYWLLEWKSTCPSGWNSYGEDCWKNGKLASAPNIPATELGDETLFAGATPGGDDWVQFFFGSEGFLASGADSVLDIATVWNQAEFNVFGDGAGSQASFNPGSRLEVNLLLDTSGAPLTCLGPLSPGTTAETNNYLLGTCSTSNGQAHSIDFTESLATGGWNLIPGGGTTNLPLTAAVLNNELFLFSIGINDHAHYVNQLSGSHWTGWSPVPGGGTTELADSAVEYNGRLYIFGIGIGDHGHYMNSFDGSTWKGWSAVPGGGTTVLADSATVFNGRLYLFGIGIGDHGFYMNSFDGNTWTGWSALPGGGLTDLSASAVSYDGRLYLFCVGTDSAHWMNSFDGAAWSGWSHVPGGGTTNLADTAAVFDGQLSLFSISPNNNAQNVNTFNGSKWTGWLPLVEGGQTNKSDAAAAYQGHLLLFSVGSSSDHIYETIVE
jgi:hypothetical protein